MKKKDYSERVNYVNLSFSVERDLNMKVGLSLKQVFYAFYTEELNWKKVKHPGCHMNVLSVFSLGLLTCTVLVLLMLIWPNFYQLKSYLHPEIQDWWCGIKPIILILYQSERNCRQQAMWKILKSVHEKWL